jgi:hypothetical protein
VTWAVHFDGLKNNTPIGWSASSAGPTTSPGRPSGSSRTDAPTSDGALESKHTPRAGRREERSDALKYNRALRLKYEGQRGTAFLRRPESDALKYNRVLELKYGGRVGFGRLDARFRPPRSPAAGGEARDAVGNGFEPVPARGPVEFRWVYDPSRTTIRSEGNEDSTPAVRRTDGI